MTVDYDFTCCDLTDLRRAAPGIDLLDLARGCAAVGGDDAIVVHPEGTVRVQQRRQRASTVATTSHQQARRVK